VIISHRHRFVFMHCRKAAGSSIAAALAPHLGPDDLHLGTWPEALEAGVRPNRRARRDLAHPLAAGSFAVRWLRRPARWGRFAHVVDALNGAQRLKYRRPLGASPEHAYAASVQAWAPAAWRDYFKFCFVRNPFERAVSDYVWRTRKTGSRDLTFRAFLERMQARDFSDRAVPRHFDNWPIYTIDDRIAVDFVGRFERLGTDLAAVFEQLGLPPPTLGHAKRTDRGRDWRGFYGAPERALVQRLFAREIETFDYGF
jgi:hypothetical protein